MVKLYGTEVLLTVPLASKLTIILKLELVTLSQLAHIENYL